ncbi:glycoside hydrolase family 18 protein [Vagococcus sp. BWB3-3]|uniref:Glycoside hydrolase family 18 protein n=1 Tax=Vagococcus allomyrinae TaxID=2794353 RepID=A0A940STK5_9ENTE|nr:glycoside hydrolase family 18 protein [Vagococcus allomyrinae]MBP1039794.1 glycoside hydrolase family 18 protein [Vagococcus allomyrinae]
MKKKHMGIKWCLLMVISLIQLLFLTAPLQVKAVESSFRTIGYLPDYDTKFIEATIDFSQLTDVNYFAVVPQTNGTLKFTDSGHSDQLESLVTEAHKANVRVGVSIGGWGLSDYFAEATSEANQSKFIDEILAFVKKYQLDTVDIDWEYPAEEYADQYVGFIKNLKKALGKKINLSICVPTGVASNGQATGRWENHFKPEALKEADWVNIMAYDAQVEGAPNHSPAELQKNSLNYWNDLMGGDQLGKLVGGIPFYGKAENGAVVTYSKIVAESVGVPNTDSIEIAGQIYYFNSKGTVQKKVQDTIDLGALGVMIWAPTQDAAVKSSNRLMNVVVNTVSANNVSLDEPEFTVSKEPAPEVKSAKWLMYVFVVLIAVVAVLLFRGHLLYLLPKRINGKRVRRANLAKGISVLLFLVDIVLLLFLLLPTLVALLLMLAILVALYAILRD